MADFEVACREAGLKLTHQRTQIYRELASATDHPAAETLHSRLRIILPTLSLDTVYRTLTTFEKYNLVARVQTVESHARFEADMEPHHHAICTRCGKITDFQWDIFEQCVLPEPIMAWGRINCKHITFHGTCAKCAKKIVF